MDVRQSYNLWANQYDSNENKTRDLEAIALRETLSDISFDTCLEIGCGTGKNTAWLLTKAKHVIAVDLSEEMLVKAKGKIISENVRFLHADINDDWTFIKNKADLITFSLVLEHIEDLDQVFHKASSAVNANGYMYIGELHPFKQYTGTKARFETENGQLIVKCFNHHVSDFVDAAKKNRFEIVSINEYFDDPDKKDIPRILCLLFKKI
jgi:ubiquinone/menaquinone biosynthesis C-methylase UbiE